MEQTPALTPTPTILPPSTDPPVYGPVATPEAPVSQPKSKPVNFKLLMIIAGAIIVFVLGFFAYSTSQRSGSTSTPEAVITVTPTPTPIQVVNPFASSSAFMEFENHVTGLPDIIQRAVLEDQTITPPVLDLNLGF